VNNPIPSYFNYLNTVEGRNELFPFFIGLLIVAGGSASTIVYYVAAAYVIFFNPGLGLSDLWIRVWRVHCRFPLLFVFPLFVLSLFLFSVGRPNSEELLQTIASHFQLLFIVPIAVGMMAISSNRDCVQYFIDGLRTGTVIILPIAILQVAVFNTRPEGFSGNSLVFAFVLSLACMLGLLQTRQQHSSGKLLAYVPSILAFFLVIISFSRAPIIVAFALILVTLLFFSKHNLSPKKLITVIALFVATTMVGVAAIAATDFGARYFDKRIVEPVTNISKGELSDNSIRKRLDLNLSGLHAFASRPVAGHGLQNTVAAANQASEDALGSQTAYDFSHLHNEYLNYAVAGGIILLLQYLLVMAAPVMIGARGKLQKLSTYERQFSILVPLGFTAIALTNVVLGHDIMSTFFSICMVLALITRMKAETQESI